MAETQWQPSRYPALAAFLDGYLHQEFRLVHGSARGAAQAFLHDAGPVQVNLVRAELQRLERSLDGEPLSTWRAALQELGGAWWPRSMREVRALIRVLATGDVTS